MMFTRVLSGATATLVSAALLAGCGGGGSGMAPPVNHGSGTSAVRMKIVVPGRSVTAKNGKRIPLYTSIGTKGIGVEYHVNGASPVFASGTAPSKTPTFGAAIAPGATGNAACTAAAGDGSYSCTLYIPSVPAGYDDFRIALWNVAPAGCTPAGATCNFNTGTALSFTFLNDQAIEGGVNNVSSVISAPPVPALTAAAGGSYTGPVFVKTTYVTANGETATSPEATITLSGANDQVTIAAPPAVAGATGWNAYVSTSSGSETLQPGSPNSFGVPYTADPSIPGTTVPGTNTNNLNFTLSPIVDNVAVTLNTGIVDGAASTMTAYVTAKDAAGNIILGGDPYVDASGNPMTISLSFRNNPGNSLTFTGGAPSFTSGGNGNTATIAYDGVNAFPPTASVPLLANNIVTGTVFFVTSTVGLHAGQSVTIGQSGSTDTLTIATVNDSQHFTTSTGAAFAHSTGDPVFLPAPSVHVGASPLTGGSTIDANISVTYTGAGLNVPQIPQVTNTFAAAGAPTVMAPMSDGLLYIAEGASAQRLNPNTVTGSALTLGSTSVGGIAAGTDGGVWYTDNQHGTVDKQPTGDGTGGDTQSALVSGSLGEITAGPDGNMWFTDLLSGSIDSITAGSMTVTAYASGHPFTTGPIATGTFSNGDKAACGASWSSGPSTFFGCVNISNPPANGAISASGTLGVGYAESMAFGPDGQLYIAQSNHVISTWYLDALHFMNANATANYTLPNSGMPHSLVVGPDGALWFYITGDTTGKVLGRIALTQTGPFANEPYAKGVLNEWGGYAAMGFPFAASYGPYALALGADHALWLTDTTNFQVDRISP